MIILAFESSCDETSVAVAEIENGIYKIRSNIVASQITMHTLYGGVVPEIASRAHTEAISKLTYEALSEAEVTPDDIDFVAVTSNPGLIGALLVGVGYAKAWAYANNKPLVAVNHIKGHTAAAYYSHEGLQAPFFALVASGGHTSMIDVKSPTQYVTVGRTRDDAAGEAFDKVARLLGIGYPGGAIMDKLAYEGNEKAIKLPCPALADSIDFSFSGLKTAVINYVNSEKQRGNEISHADIASSFSASVVKAIITNLEKAHTIYGYKTLVIAGGVAANSHIRAAAEKFANERGIRLCIPEKSLCGDNAAMIAAQGYHEYLAGNIADSSLNAFSYQVT